MIFHNPNSVTMTFDIGMMHYVVPPGDECDIPMPLVYAVKLMGLLLKEGKSPAGGAQVEAESVTHRVPVVADGLERGGVPAMEASEEYPDPVGEVSPAVAEASEALKGVKLPGNKKRHH